MFKIQIKTNNDAFREDCRGEIARILEELVDDIRNAKEPETLVDYNGNTVGKISWNI